MDLTPGPEAIFWTDLRSPFHAFEASSARSPQACLLRAPASAELPYAPGGFQIRYGEMKQDVEELRASYLARGYGRGARVALLLESRPAFFKHWLALNSLGASIVPINPDLRPAELTFQLRVSQAQLLVSAADRMTLARSAELGTTLLREEGDEVPPCRVDVSAQDGNRASECAVLFTSGSTGVPKGCLLSNEYFLRLAQWYLSQGGVAAFRGAGETNLTPLPMFHMNALGCSAVAMMALGGTVAPLDRFHASRWWSSVADSGATVVHCLGVIPAILLQLPESPAERRHSVRFAFAPGVDERHRLMFESRFGIPIVDAWAMTETGGAACTTTAREPATFAARCIGRPASGMEYRIVDDAMRDVPLGEPGELLVRTAGANPRSGFFSGYLNEPDATEEAWRGGWFHTGDFVRAGEDGLLYFFDRKKSIVRRSGENIGVLEVESVLNALAEVEASGVTPVPDDVRGEEVFAFIVRSRDAGEGNQQLAREIMASCAETLAYHKVPGYIAFVEALPLSPTRKLARGEIKALGARAAQEGAAFDLRDLKTGLRKKA
jgi:acyl-CoA synthetase (AMP-forming)/AMP-acid ligase II